MRVKYSSLKSAARTVSLSLILLLAFSAAALAQGGRYPVDPWSFGVHGDTQWTVAGNPGDNPNYVSAAVARALNEQFIAEGVKFVIQVGDLSDRAGNDAMYTRADVAQPLYDAGIGFFPLRGNHETYGMLFGRDPDHDMNVPAFLDAFPQTQGTANTFGATNFSSPAIPELQGLSYAFEYSSSGSSASFVIVDVEQTYYWEQLPTPHPIYGLGFDYPSFYPIWVLYKHTEDVYGEVIIEGEEVQDQLIPAGSWFRINSSGDPSTNFYGWESFWPPDVFAVPQASKWVSTGTEFWPGDQQDWISATLDKTTRSTEHAFVFSHRGLMGANHVDCFFGSNPGSKSASQIDFYQSLAENDVKYMISGHDHLHNRALVASPLGTAYPDMSFPGDYEVEQLIAQGASSKFYGPAPLDDFNTYYGDVKRRETQISQEIYNIGYYIYTVDGPRVTVDYYSDYIGNFEDGDDYPDGSGSLEVPAFDFVKKETWGYSLNGRQFLVQQGESYTDVEDSFNGTAAMIIGGTNNSTTTDYTPYDYDDEGNPYNGPRSLTKTVNTGWVEKPAKEKMIASDILSIWGMTELGSDSSDIYVLQMSYDERRVNGKHKGNAGYRLASLNGSGNWVKAVDLNIGKQKKKFMKGSWEDCGSPLELGAYGVDVKNKVVWAVINYDADFAVRF